MDSNEIGNATLAALDPMLTAETLTTFSIRLHFDSLVPRPSLHHAKIRNLSLVEDNHVEGLVCADTVHD